MGNAVATTTVGKYADTVTDTCGGDITREDSQARIREPERVGFRWPAPSSFEKGFKESITQHSNGHGAAMVDSGRRQGGRVQRR